MESNNRIKLTLNSAETLVAVEDALSFCQQLIANRSAHTIDAFEQLLLNDNLPEQYAKSVYQLAFSYLNHKQNYYLLLKLARHALHQDKHWPYAHYAKALAHRFLREPKQAVNALTVATSLAPTQVTWYRLLGTMYKELGEKQQAQRCFTHCIEQAPADYESYWLRSDFAPLLNDSELARLVDFLEQNLQDTLTRESVRQSAHQHAITFAAFTLFRHFNATKNYQRAFDYLTHGNQALSQLVPFALSNELAEHHACVEVFDQTLLSRGQNNGQQGKKSIFICGLPRSGTTLVEQILASHSQVNAGDELFYLAQASQRVLKRHQISQPFPHWAKQLSPNQWQELGTEYLNACRELAQGNWLTDKMPLNYKAIGVIRNALPNAKIIYCRRKREDVIWGCYKQILGKGNGFSNDLAHLKAIYQAHDSLMQHWQSHVSENLFELNYEALVQQPKPVIEQLCRFIGIDYQEQMLRFFDNKQPIHTISSSQVRQPISTRYINDWQHYQQWLNL